jgi:hypothetical protein
MSDSELAVASQPFAGPPAGAFYTHTESSKARSGIFHSPDQERSHSPRLHLDIPEGGMNRGHNVRRDPGLNVFVGKCKNSHLLNEPYD